MSAESIAAIVAAAVSGVVAVVSLLVVVMLTRRVHEMRQMVRDLGTEAVPLVHDARVVMGQAATEMERVGDVLASAEAVSGTVDSASRLAYRAFANPVVKVLAFGTGATSALRRLFSRRPSQPRPRPRDAASPSVSQSSSARVAHRRRRRVASRR
jgi:hypothetical protein